MAHLATRLTRLLSIVPYFLAHPGQSMKDAAKALGMSAQELHRDLNLLWLCGLPGYSPGDLIDISFAGDSVEVGFSAGVDRPLRLTRSEATLLVVALRALAELPSGVDPTAALSAIAKIETASHMTSELVPRPPAPGAERPEDELAGPLPPAGEAENGPVIEAARGALAAGRALKIQYYSATSDAVTERVIDPIRVVLQGRRSYVQAWCRTSQAVRLFRLDRLEAAAELPEPAKPPVRPPASAGFWGQDAEALKAVVAVAPEAAWALEHHSMAATSERADDGWLVAKLSYGSPDWLRRFLLGFGGEIRLLEPAWLADETTEAARSALRRYAAVALTAQEG